MPKRAFRKRGVETEGSEETKVTAKIGDFFANQISFYGVYLIRVEIWEQIVSDREVGARRLVAEFGDRLFRTAVALCKDVHIAEDLVFRTFERVIAKIDRFDTAQSFWNWIYTIMYNLYRSDLRKFKVMVFDNPKTLEDITDNIDQRIFVERLSEADAVLLRRSVEMLAPIYREVVMLRYFEDKTLLEMSEIMHVSVGTLKWRLHKARSQLAVLLQEAFEPNKGINT